VVTMGGKCGDKATWKLTRWDVDNIVIPKRRSRGQRDIVFDECWYDVEPIVTTVRKQQFRRDELVLIQAIVVLVVESPPKIQLGRRVLIVLFFVLNHVLLRDLCTRNRV
jgi:hypothetical protein